MVGQNTHIGTGTKITQYLKIDDNCIIAAGATIYKNIPSNMLVKQKIDTVMDEWV